MVAHSAFHPFRGFFGRQPVLGLAHELRFADKARHQRAAACQQILAGDLFGLAVLHQIAIGAHALQDRGPEPRLMRATFGGGHGVAIGLQETVAHGRPVDRPFHTARHAVFFGKANLSGKRPVRIGCCFLKRIAQIIGQAAGKVKIRLQGGFAVIDRGFPADFDAREQIGLRPYHFQQPRRFHLQRAKDFGIGVEGHGGAAPVGGRADLLHRALRDTARKALAEQLAVARHLHHHAVGQRIHHRGADTVQPARGLIGLAVELAARVQGAQDHLQRRFAGKLRMRIHRDAPAIVADRHAVIGVQLYFDAVGMACHRFVHRIVQNFGHQVMQGAFIRAADIHPRPLADRFQPFQHLDGRGVVVVVLGGEHVTGHGMRDSSWGVLSGGLDHSPPLAASARNLGIGEGRRPSPIFTQVRPDGRPTSPETPGAPDSASASPPVPDRPPSAAHGPAHSGHIPPP